MSISPKVINKKATRANSKLSIKKIYSFDINKSIDIGNVSSAKIAVIIPNIK